MKKLTLLSLLLSGLFIVGCDDDDNESPAPTIDLAAESLEVTVDKVSATEGTIFLRGTVKNIGGDFVSGEGQQKVYLTEKYPGGQSTTVAQKAFTVLSAGAIIELKYSRQWRTSAEFPPEYTLRISYGPDIYLDGNDQNDDKNMNNNSRKITGAQINARF